VGDDRIVFRCNNMDALATAVADGLGLGVLPRLVGARHASLRCLSGDQPVLRREMWLAVPRELRHVPRIRAVSDWLVERFRADTDLYG
jgi:DNA-binding transcriptional LysR family regulator